ncbi:MAG: AAA family ATPase [Meiothermus sp.]|nr:AAA family ATPase [Meiothermus sp.]
MWLVLFDSRNSNSFTHLFLEQSPNAFSNTNSREMSIEMDIEPNEFINENVWLKLVFLRPVDDSYGQAQVQLVYQSSGIHLRSESREIRASQKNPNFIVTAGEEVDFNPIMKIMHILSDTLYIGPYRNVINSGGTNYFDTPIGQSFISSWHTWKNGAGLVTNRTVLKITRFLKEVFGFDSLEINAVLEPPSLKVFVNDEPYELNELGSGLSQLLFVLTIAAMQRPSFIMIDEPELHLHPSLQTRFLENLSSYTKRGLVFSTHSIGLARTYADFVYSVSRNERNKPHIKKFEAQPDLSLFLGEMSYSSHIDVGFDQILLVEGPTELKTMRQLLRLHGKDHKVMLLPLGGGDFINGEREHELSEIKTRILPNISALIDSEKDSDTSPLENNRQEFKAVCQRVGIKLHVLERRALENYFPDHAIQAEKGDSYRALTPFEKLKTASPSWGKWENWKIASHMSLHDLEGNDLGRFLESL